ncbi:TetR/AcrR family transcriptional regulator [Bacillus sp. CLL-7-23]|uniref:TetR/AcrR family transcriptional regulator n=1 Tax=Bacillus changyiensis TaxID=3004103 RepID=A0ABT4X180_9BACI|nr:TetR/AcrR family transcriptional regulator [Bacillus changyiensis]MDA7025454.1 TetR/AcrR family transcriptional regulator [Bacillus changyiensis]
MDREALEQLLQVNDQEVKMSEKQQKIVMAAIEMFSEKGFASTSTSEIAKKAGVAEGTIFRHYKTKKDLLLSIVMPTIINTAAPKFAKSFAKEVFDHQYESYEDFVREILSNRFAFVKKYFPVVKIYFQEVFYHEEMRNLFKTIFNDHVYEKFKQIIEYFKEKGELADLPAESIIRMTITSIVGLIITRFLISEDMDEEQEKERTIQFIMNGVRKR